MYSVKGIYLIGNCIYLLIQVHHLDEEFLGQFDFVQRHSIYLGYLGNKKAFQSNTE